MGLASRLLWNSKMDSYWINQDSREKAWGFVSERKELLRQIAKKGLGQNGGTELEGWMR